MLHSAAITGPRSDVFAVVDLGSTKIVCLIVKVCNNNPEIIGVGYKASKGIDGGAVTNMEYATNSVLSCIESAKQVAQVLSVSEIYVNISGCDICSTSVINEINSTVHKISDVDVRNIILQTYEKCHEDQVVVHNIPIVYHLDDLNNVIELKGLYGSKLKANMHVITASKFALLNIENCVANCALNISGCVVESYASGISCVTKDERELGTMVIDIGGKYTSIGVFDKGKFVYADSIPLGGIHITNDIAYGLCIGVKDAERIKVLYGDAVLTSPDKDGIIEADVGEDEIISVTRSNLIKIINPRVEEIFDLVKDRVAKQKNLINKVVITGGSSKLSNIKEVASYVLNKHVRLGLPIVLKGINDDYKCNPIFSAAIGMTLLVLNTVYTKERTKYKKNSILEKFLKMIPIKHEW